MDRTVLLVVDVQTELVESHPYNKQNVIENIQKLIEIARKEDLEVIYVQHDDGFCGEPGQHSIGWEIYEGIAPQPTEKIFEKKHNSAFKQTGLKEYLDDKGISTIILVGMQTDYCIDATCKVAFEYGYTVIIPQNTTTTFDNDWLSGESLVAYYEQGIWNQRYASVIPLETVIKDISA